MTSSHQDPIPCQWSSHLAAALPTHAHPAVPRGGRRPRSSDGHLMGGCGRDRRRSRDSATRRSRGGGGSAGPRGGESWPRADVRSACARLALLIKGGLHRADPLEAWMPTGPARPPAKPAKVPCGGLRAPFAGFAGPRPGPFRAGFGPFGEPGTTGLPVLVRKKREKWADARRAANYYVFYVTTSGSMGPDSDRVDSRGPAGSSSPSSVLCSVLPGVGRSGPLPSGASSGRPSLRPLRRGTVRWTSGVCSRQAQGDSAMARSRSRDRIRPSVIPLQ